MNEIMIFILGYLITGNIIFTWYSTTISEKILSIFIKTDNKYASYSDFMDKISEKNEFISELLSCQICFSHWISFAVSMVLCFIFDITFLFTLISMFSWPSLVYKFYFK